MSDLLDIMSQPPRYPVVAGYKRTETSRDAADKVDAAGLRAKTLEALRRFGPMTADQVAEALNLDKLSIRPRLTELRELGKVADSGERRPNASGRNAIVWEIIQ